VNDPCLDPAPNAPFPENFLRTVQSETTIAILNGGRGEDDSEGDWTSGARLMVAGYNDSFGFYNNRQGLSGVSYSTNGGKLWIDASGLPPIVQSSAPAGSLGSDAYFGDPSLVVDQRSRTFLVSGVKNAQKAGTFYYASIYLSAAGFFTLSVNRGRFQVAPQQVPVESQANTRCAQNPALFGVPDAPPFVQERIIWEPPVEAVPPPFLGAGNGDFLDKEWLYIDQKTGFLYLTYTRFATDGSTPIELVRSFDGGRTWTPPSVVVPNLNDTFNSATQAVVTPTGRVIVSWQARTFPAPAFIERDHRIEVGLSDDGGATFGSPVVVTHVNPQGEPPGYNRGRNQLLNAPSIVVDKGRDDGVTTDDERERRGFGNVYITYFSGLTPFATSGGNPSFARAGNIFASTSQTNGTTWQPRVQVNNDQTPTSHVFPSAAVNQNGELFIGWLDRRLDSPRNLLTDTWGDISTTAGRTFGKDTRITGVSTDWITREDAQPDYGDYNSSTTLNYDQFVTIWADGRFPTPAPLTQTPTGGFTRAANQAATPDSLMAIVPRPGNKD